MQVNLTTTFIIAIALSINQQQLACSPSSIKENNDDLIDEENVKLKWKKLIYQYCTTILR